MGDMEFTEVDADGFDLLDYESGNLVRSFDERTELLADLPELVRNHNQGMSLVVIAVDEKGQRLGSWLATDLFVTG